MREDEDQREVARRVAEGYARSGAPDPGARERLLEQIGRLPPPRAGNGVGERLTALITRHPGRLALAAGLVLVTCGGMMVRAWEPGSPRDGVMPATPDAPLVRFEIAAPGAARVTLVGDFNGWDRAATPMHRASAPDIWTVSLPVARGRHAYGFFVDGSRWVADPLAPLAPADGFGGVNSVIVVAGPEPS